MIKFLLIIQFLTTSAHIEYNLHKHLFTNYSTSIRPVRLRRTTTIVKFNMKLMRIIAVDEKTQMVTSQAYFSVKWSDEFVKWNPRLWGRIDSIAVRPNMIWIPDIILKNNANSDAIRIQKDTETVWVKHTGKCSWYPKVTIMSSFRADVTYFPFDSQNFIFHFGSWSFDERHLKIVKEKKQMLSIHYLNDSEWDLVRMDNHNHRSKYGTTTYSEIIFTYFFSRKPTYSVITAIVPSIGLMSMALFSYLLPPDLGERIAVLITSLLAFTVFLVEINGSLPRNSDTVPIVQVFYMVTMAECIMCFIVSCLLARLVAVRKHSKVPFDIPMWMQNMMHDSNHGTDDNQSHDPQHAGFSKGLMRFTKELVRKCSAIQMMGKCPAPAMLLQNQTNLLNFSQDKVSVPSGKMDGRKANNKKSRNYETGDENICKNSHDEDVSRQKCFENDDSNNIRDKKDDNNNLSNKSYKSTSSTSYDITRCVFEKAAVEGAKYRVDRRTDITWGMFAECMDKICLRVFSIFFFASSVGIFVAAYLKQSSIQRHFLGAH